MERENAFYLSAHRDHDLDFGVKDNRRCFRIDQNVELGRR